VGVATQREISNERVAILGLPSCEAIEAVTRKPELADHYGIVCRAIEKLRAGKVLDDFTARKLPVAQDAVQKALLPAKASELSPTSVNLWLQLLLEADFVQEARRGQNTRKRDAIRSAPPLLRFFTAIAQATDLGAWANSATAQTLELSDLFAGAPVAAPRTQAGPCRLVFCVYQQQWTPLFSVDMLGAETGVLSPSPPGDLIISTEAFYNESGGPQGGITEESIQGWINAAWGDGALADLPSLMAALDARSKEWLGEGLAGLPAKLGIRAAPRLQARLATATDEQFNPHAKLLVKTLNESAKASLLKSVCERLSSHEAPHEVMSLDHPQLAELLGHMDTQGPERRNPAFPLDVSQRLAARVAISAVGRDSSSIVPVNGPPGSGKTSFLRAVLASLWVSGAINKAPHPPVVYGTGATNKAVANIIEAFGAVRGTIPGTLEYPWIEGLPSYGWFFPSTKAAQDRPDLMQIIRKDRNRLTPGAAAVTLQNIDAQALQDRHATLLNRASALLKESGGSLSLETVLELVNAKLTSMKNELHERQKSARHAIESACQKWVRRRPLREQISELKTHAASYRIEAETTSHTRACIQSLIGGTKLVLHEDRFLHSGWRGVFTRLRDKLYARRIQDLKRLRQQVSTSLEQIGHRLPLEIAATEQLLSVLSEKMEQLTSLSENALSEAQRLDRDRQVLENSLKEHLESVADVVAACNNGRGSLSVLRALCHATKNPDLERRRWAHNTLIHLSDATLDARLRVPMFHWAARYWEARWLQEWLRQPTLKQPSDAQSIERLMMLGVIIVATTHKVVDLGQMRKVDLLIMDEAGQCQPHVAASLLALTQKAVFVGDVLQLKPINSMSEGVIQAIASQAGLTHIPEAVRPDRGSGMDLARASTTFSSKSRPTDEPTAGILLRYHYRCLPSIIGYCNETMYGGRIVNARDGRSRPSSVGWMPAMSWVHVSGEPQRRGQSWINEAQAHAIVDWIARHSARLTAKGQKRLAEVVAVISPLGAQIHKIRDIMEARLGPDAIQEMVIGTVHALQGAEKPVVLFSLVQTSATNTAGLMADRGGGNLMNVAVSRAQDAFVVFADRNTLKPAPGDTDNPEGGAGGPTPVAALGRYMRKHGERLYPNSLFVVEAPGKVAALSKILGPDAAVIATGGSLKTSTLRDDGTLLWTDLVGTKHPAQEAWRRRLQSERGLFKEVLIATDDDLAGELIGLHAAQDVAAAFGPAALPIRRMRFHAITPEAVEAAYRAAGHRFDSGMLAAALLREFHRHVDLLRYRRVMQSRPYSSPQQRDALGWMDEELRRRGVGHLVEVHGEVQPAEGTSIPVFLCGDSGAAATPLRLAMRDAMAIAQHPLPTDLPVPKARNAQQLAPPYPANTTARVLALCADELGMAVSDAQEELNGLYLEGARVE
jgi:hypothetical protein